MSDKKTMIKSFLNKISQIESSGGKNLKHKTMTSGIHEGSSAIGRYGLMPNTVSEVLNRMRLAGSLHPELSGLRSADPVTLKQTLETNPQLEDQIAEALATRVLERQPLPEMAAYSWNMGTNLTPEQIQERDYLNSDYVKKFKALNGDENE